MIWCWCHEVITSDVLQNIPLDSIHFNHPDIDSTPKHPEISTWESADF